MKSDPPTNEKKYSLVVPVFFVLFTVASVISIVGNAVQLQSVEEDSSSNNNRTISFKIVVSAILTGLFASTAIFAFIEFFEPSVSGNNYKPRLLTQDFEKMLARIVERSESHEILLFIGAFILLPIGLASSLVSGENEQLIFSVIFIVIAYYTYNNRISTRSSIRRALPLNKEITLPELSRLLSKDQKTVRKALLHLISYEGYPAHYDFKSEKIIYGGELLAQTTVIPNQDTVVIEETAETVEEKSLVPCAYCGATPLVANAMFCSECGASMIATK